MLKIKNKNENSLRFMATLYNAAAKIILTRNGINGFVHSKARNLTKWFFKSLPFQASTFRITWQTTVKIYPQCSKRWITSVFAFLLHRKDGPRCGSHVEKQSLKNSYCFTGFKLMNTKWWHESYPVKRVMRCVCRRFRRDLLKTEKKTRARKNTDLFRVK